MPVTRKKTITKIKKFNQIKQLRRWWKSGNVLNFNPVNFATLKFLTFPLYGSLLILFKTKGFVKKTDFCLKKTNLSFDEKLFFVKKEKTYILEESSVPLNTCIWNLAGIYFKKRLH